MCARALTLDEAALVGGFDLDDGAHRNALAGLAIDAAANLLGGPKGSVQAEHHLSSDSVASRLSISSRIRAA